MINRSRFTLMLQRLMGLDADDGVSFLDPSVAAVFEIEPYRAEHRWLAGDRRFAGHITVAAQAATMGTARLANVAGSNMLCVIERIEMATSVAAAYNFSVGVGFGAPLASQPAAGGVRLLDTRSGTVASPACALASALPAASPVVPNYAYGIASASELRLKWSDEIVLGPGGCVDVTSDTNMAIYVTFIWRERALPQIEQNI